MRWLKIFYSFINFLPIIRIFFLYCEFCSPPHKTKNITFSCIELIHKDWRVILTPSIKRRVCRVVRYTSLYPEYGETEIERVIQPSIILNPFSPNSRYVFGSRQGRCHFTICKYLPSELRLLFFGFWWM